MCAFCAHMPYFCILTMSEYVKELLEFNPNYDETLLEMALDTATKMHKDQKRKSGEPYIIHPMAVGKILAELGVDIIAGFSGRRDENLYREKSEGGIHHADAGTKGQNDGVSQGAGRSGIGYRRIQ